MTYGKNNISTISMLHGLSRTPAPTKGKALTASASTTRKNITVEMLNRIETDLYTLEKNEKS